MTTLKINDSTVDLDVDDEMPILWLLRDQLQLTGTKFGCGAALCGACTIHLDGTAVRSCVTPVSAAHGKAITTIEAIGDDAVGAKVQAAWIRHQVAQCGYCQSGQMMSAVALLKRMSKPEDDDLDDAMAGNLCRCGTYQRIRTAIKDAARSI